MGAKLTGPTSTCLGYYKLRVRFFVWLSPQGRPTAHLTPGYRSPGAAPRASSWRTPGTRSPPSGTDHSAPWPAGGRACGPRLSFGARTKVPGAEVLIPSVAHGYASLSLRVHLLCAQTRTNVNTKPWVENACSRSKRTLPPGCGDRGAPQAPPGPHPHPGRQGNVDCGELLRCEPT